MGVSFIAYIKTDCLPYSKLSTLLREKYFKKFLHVIQLFKCLTSSRVGTQFEIQYVIDFNNVSFKE